MPDACWLVLGVQVADAAAAVDVDWLIHRALGGLDSKFVDPTVVGRMSPVH